MKSLKALCNFSNFLYKKIEKIKLRKVQNSTGKAKRFEKFAKSDDTAFQTVFNLVYLFVVNV